MNEDKPDSDMFMKILSKISEKWLIFLSIIIILALVWYDVATIQTQKVEIMDKCNEHWRGAVKKVCPLVLNNSPGIWMDLDEDFLEENYET